MAGWGLGWYTYKHWGTDPVPSAQPVIPVPSKPVDPEAAAVFIPAAPGPGDNLVPLLQRNEFDAVLERYEFKGSEYLDAIKAGDPLRESVADVEEFIFQFRFHAFHAPDSDDATVGEGQRQAGEGCARVSPCTPSRHVFAPAWPYFTLTVTGFSVDY